MSGVLLPKNEESNIVYSRKTRAILKTLLPNTETVAILPRQFSWNGKDLLRQEQKYSNQPLSETRSVPQQYKNFFAKVISLAFHEGGFLEGFNYFPVTSENSPGTVTNHNLLKLVYSLGFFLNLLLRSIFPKFDNVCFFLVKVGLLVVIT